MLFKDLASRELLERLQRIAPSDATTIFNALFRYKVPIILVIGACAAAGLVSTLSNTSEDEPHG